MTYADKVCLITGGGSGIGRAAALEFAKRKAKIIVFDVDQNGLAETVHLVEREDAEILSFKVNVADPAQIESAIEQAVSKFGRLDIVIANAGIASDPSDGNTADVALDLWKRVIDINLSGAFYTAKFAIPKMLASDGGVIIFVASVMGKVTSAGISPYTASKHGVVGLSKTVAVEYGDQNIRSLSIAPGIIETAMTEDVLANPDASAGLLAATPVNRFGKASEVAKFMAALASDDASFATGGFYPVDGGYLAL